MNSRHHQHAAHETKTCRGPRKRASQLQTWAGVILLAVLTACGTEGGRGGRITAMISVGAPIEGAKARVYAIDSMTGNPVEGRAGGAVLAEARGSDASGRIDVHFPEDTTWNGPIQVVITGAELSYIDPTLSSGIENKVVVLPKDFRLTSLIQRYQTGTELTVPVTLWTSLADEAVLAYARGANPASLEKVPLESAIPVVDDLFAKHLSRPQSWDLRTSIPISTLTSAGPARNTVYAALSDVAIIKLAHQISGSTDIWANSTLTAYELLDLLRLDISDGLFDGRHKDAQLIARQAEYELSASTTRVELANALDSFIDSPANLTGLTRTTLQGLGILKNIALDTSILYPPEQDPTVADTVPPTVTLEAPLPEFPSTDTLLIKMSARDERGKVRRVRVRQRAVDFTNEYEAAWVGGVWEVLVSLKAGPNELDIWAEDTAIPVNSGETWNSPHRIRGVVFLDQSAPTVRLRGVHCYYSELRAPLKIEADGTPTVPGALKLRGARVDLYTQPEIHKTYVTSTWGGSDLPPAGIDLEGLNPRNLPFRRFSVSDSGEGPQSPLKSATWTIEASDGTTTDVSTGNAIPSEAQFPDGPSFNIVFTRETIPLLETTTASTVNLKVHITARDEAGNTTVSAPFELRYHLVATPLAYIKDETFAATYRADSLYIYSRVDKKYELLFKGNSLPERLAKLGRIEIFNPWPLPVAVQQSNALEYRISEDWHNSLTSIDPASVVSSDGHTFTRFEKWASQPTPGINMSNSCLARFDSACGLGWAGTSHLRHDIGSTTRLTCGSGTTPPSPGWMGIRQASNATVRYLLDEAPRKALQQELIDGQLVVVIPPASGSAPGYVAAFPGIKMDFARTWDAHVFSSSYRRFAGLFYDQGEIAYGCTEFAGQVLAARQHELKDWWQILNSARSSVTGGPVSFTARPVRIEGPVKRMVGPPPEPQNIPFAVDFSH